MQLGRARLGASGVEVTRLGFGAAPIGNLFAPVSDADAGAAVDMAWQLGVRFFDTAPLYGHGLSERRLGVVATHAVSIRRNIHVRMPDGAGLLTDLYLGNAAAGAPVILVRSPYGRSVFLAAGTAYPLASQGFNVVLQSCRGTFGCTMRTPLEAK